MKFIIFALVLLSLSTLSFADRIPIAVLDLDAKGEGLDKGVADALTESVRYQFSKQESLDLVAREKMMDLAREKAIQLTGCTDVSCAVQIGKALNVKKMITGSVTKLGGNFSIFLRVVDVEKENVECSEKEEAGTSMDNLDKSVTALAERVASCMWVPWVRNLVQQRPNDPGPHVLLGNVLSKQGKQEEAIAAYREAIRLKPEDELAFSELGEAFLRKKDYQGMENEAREALRLNPDNAPARILLGRALFNQDKNVEVEKEAREAIRLKPNIALAHNTLGLALEGQGKLGGAIDEFREAIRLKPDFYKPHWNLARLYARQNKFTEAEKEAREVNRLDPGNAAPFLEIIGVLYEQHEKTEVNSSSRIANNSEIERLAREAIRVKPNSAVCHYYLGESLRFQGRHEEAGKEYQEATRLYPNYANAYIGLSVSHLFSGKNKEALESLRMGINQGYDNWPFLDDLKSAFERRGLDIKQLADIVKKRWEEKQKGKK